MTEQIKEFVPGVSEDIHVTPKALEEVRKLMKENDIPDGYGLRVGVKGGGCSGFSYVLAFDNEERTGDNIVEIDGVKIIVDMKSNLYLSGTQIDYVENMMNKGFVFNNPNAVRTCGCGSSFGV
jgi:iron-sulfur cluster assembly protein